MNPELAVSVAVGETMTGCNVMTGSGVSAGAGSNDPAMGASAAITMNETNHKRAILKVTLFRRIRK